MAEILVAADRGEARVVAALHEVGEYLGIGLASAINAFDPDLVIVGGPLAQAGKWLMNPAKRVLQSRVLPGLSRDVPVLEGTLGPDACALGGVSIVLDQDYAMPRVKV